MISRVWRIVEVILALAAAALVLSAAGLRALWLTEVRTIVEGFGSALRLLPSDPATFVSTVLAIVRASALLGPTLAVLLRAPRHRLAWLPLLLLFFPFVFGLSVPALSSWSMWALFVFTLVPATWAVLRKRAAPFVLLPWVACFEPMLGHAPPSDLAWPPERLWTHCAGNDGTRPSDLSADVLSTRYFSVTSVSPELQLLAGERNSFWVHHVPGGAGTLGPALPKLQGNFWEGCQRDGVVWLAKRGFLCRADAQDASCRDAMGPDTAGLELDYVDVHCPPQTSKVWVSQLLRGGVLEVDTENWSQAFHPVIPGLNLQLTRPRADGKLVGITATKLVVIDPVTWKVEHEQAAGLVAMGVDLCAGSGVVVVTDFTGRVREFEPEPGGGYRLSAATFLPAPRRVAVSADCSRVLVTSGDDRHAFLLRREGLTEERVFKLGPGLRDVAFIDERTAAAADACTINWLTLP